MFSYTKGSITMLSLFVFISSYSFAADTLELTKHVLFLSGLKNKTLAYYGISCGMKLNEIKKAVVADTSLHIFIEPDKFTNHRFYLQKKFKYTTQSLAYLSWLDDDSLLDEMIIYAKGITYMNEPNRNFLALKKDSLPYIFTQAGSIEKTEVVLDVPSAQLKTTRYFFKDLPIAMEEYVMKKQRKFNLVVMKNPVNN